MKAAFLLRPLAHLPRRLLVGMAIALVSLLALGFFSYRNLTRQAEAAGWVEHTYKVATALQTVLSSVQDADSSQRMYVLTGVQANLEAFEGTLAALPGQLGRVDRLVNDNPKQVGQLRLLRRAIGERLNNARYRIAQRQELGVGALDAKYITSKVVRLMQEVRAGVGRMIATEDELLGSRLEELRVARQRSVLLQSLGGVLSLALLAAVFTGLVKQLLRADRAEKEARRGNTQLEEANAELRSFSYSVAHDLRAPLRAINGFAQVLVEDHHAQLPEPGQQALGRITANAVKMDKLIDALLALSKVSVQSLHTGKIEMTELVQGVYREIMESQNGRRVNCQIGPLPPALGDASLLRQVWHNLLGNALKFTRDREGVRIEIGGNMAGPEFATYFIRDNGAGFDMLYADKLFGAFQRLHRAAEFEGTGIGLALVHRIIHRHGGTIWAEGEENKGAFFAFTLPEWTKE